MPERTQKGKDLTSLSFEEAVKRLEKLVQQLESEEVSLSDSINQYEEGLKLIALCNEQLDQAKLRIEQVSANGKAATDS
jgi:exodeoxyribonuclease VII small subunit